MRVISLEVPIETFENILFTIFLVLKKYTFSTFIFYNFPINLYF